MKKNWFVIIKAFSGCINMAGAMWEGPKTASTKTEFHQNLAKIEIYFSYLSVNMPWNVFLCVLSSVLVNLNGPMPLATPYFSFRGAKNESRWNWRPLPAPINGVEPYSTLKYLHFWSVFMPQTPPPLKFWPKIKFPPLSQMS